MTDNDRRRSSMFDRALLLPALWASVTKLDPRHQIHNPVMFVVEVGAVITTIGWINQVFGGSPARRRRRACLVHLHRRDLALADGRLRQHGRGAGRGARARPRPTPCGRRGPRRSPTCGTAGEVAASELQQGDVVVVEAGEADPRRRHGDRGNRLGRRVGDHRRVRAR